MIRSLAGLARRAGLEIWSAGLLLRTGVVRPLSVGQLTGILKALNDYGLMGAGTRIAALRDPDGVAIIDELGPLTFGDLDRRSDAVAAGWRRRGLQPGTGVAVLCRNHRGFYDAVFGAAKCGARLILLNTGFGPDQLADVVAREGVELLVHDEEFTAVAGALQLPMGRFLAWHSETSGPDTLERLIGDGDGTPPPPPGIPPKIIILTSGTTGTPKGAARSEPHSLIPVGGLFGKVPFRAREVTECAVPLFHSLGFSQAMFAMVLGSTLVIRRGFDPAATLNSLHANRATALIVVPIMLHRMLDQGPVGDLPDLRVIFVGGSQLGAGLCRRALERFGPVVYNMYGSTEVAFATIATPADLAAEPGCVGTVVAGSAVRILDDAGRPVPPGTPGRIFVGNVMQFEGYTGGGSKEIVDGLLSSGDVGHFDTGGRLFIDGRDDEMVISGGEKVFPSEVEDALERHPDIAEAAVIGVDDAEFGQRLRSFIVTKPGRSLTADDVKSYVAQRLARFKVPRDVVFTAALPRNPSGKVLKRLLDRD